MRVVIDSDTVMSSPALPGASRLALLTSAILSLQYACLKLLESMGFAESNGEETAVAMNFEFLLVLMVRVFKVHHGGELGMGVILCD